MNDIKEIKLKKFEFVLQQRVSQEMVNNLQTDVVVDQITKDLILTLRHRPYGEIIDKIKYPDGWKEALKEAFFNWANGRNYLKKFIAKHPIKYVKYDIAAFYPSIPGEENVMTFMQIRGWDT